MKFYSYDYVLSQIRQENWALIIVSLVLLILTGFLAFRGYRNQRDSKYRELAIISGLTLLTLGLISFNNFQVDQASNNQFQTSIHFFDVVSKELNVKREEVYVNTSAATDGAIVKVKNNYYRAISGSEPDTYLLEKMELHKANVELVEVEK